MIIGYGRAAKFAVGSGGIETNYSDTLSNSVYPVAWSGVGHFEILRNLQRCQLDFYYIDTGYIGNKKLKTYKRITKNKLNDDREIIDRPNDRLSILTVDREQYKRGSDILIIPPDQKVLNCWAPGIILEEWLTDIQNMLKSLTDRKVIIRTRIKNRADRLVNNKFTDSLKNNVHATLVWSSNCAVESVLHGIPVINLGPTATTKVSPFILDQVNDVPDLDPDLVESWIKHISYCQFTDEEMKSGLAWNLLNQ